MSLERPLTAFSQRLTKPLVAESNSLVIFGGGGDLAKRKLLPGLYNLLVDGALPEQFAVIGMARTERSDEDFRAFAKRGYRTVFTT